MRRGHFEAFQPVCPACRTSSAAHPLVLQTVWEEQQDHVLHGLLGCPNPGCQREYPIIDGVPILFHHIRDGVGQQLLGLLARQDLPEPIESLLGDCCGPGSDFNAHRLHLSHYAPDHYGEWDSQPWKGVGAIKRLSDAVFALAPPEPGGLSVDLGCTVGRSTYELAHHTGGLTLGFDLNLTTLRLAGQGLRNGFVQYPRRRVGIAFDRRAHPIHPPSPELVDFWAADALALPLPHHSVSNALSLNLIDCVSSPIAHVHGLGSLLRPGGRGWICAPYDWSTTATDLSQWIGGHSQRSDDRGDSPTRLLGMISPEQCGLRVEETCNQVPWQVRTNERSRTFYDNHLIALRAEARTAPAPAPPTA